MKWDLSGRRAGEYSFLSGFFARFALGGFLLAGGMGLNLHAADGTWSNNTGDSDANWSSSANWNSGNVPGVSNLSTANSDVATFSAAAVVETPILDSNRRLGSITIDNSQADYSIATSASTNVLYLGSSTTGITITGGGFTTIAPVINLGNSQTWNTGSTAVTLTNGITFGGSRTLTLTNSAPVVVQGTVSASSNATLTFSGSGSMIISGTIQNGGGATTLDGSATFSGTLHLSGANTFTTSMIWRSGTLELGSDGALGGVNTLQLGTNNTGASAVNVLTTGAYTVARNITVSSGSVSVLHTIGGSHTSGTSVYSGTVTMNNHAGGFRLTAAAGGTVDFSNTISGANTTNDSITKVGNGVVRLTKATGNTYAGGTTVSAGTLLINNTSNSGTGTGAVSVSAGGTLGGTGRIASTGANGISVAGSGSIAPGDGGIGTLTFDFSGTTGVASMASGSTFKFELGIANASLASIAAGSSDLIALTGVSAGDFVFNGNVIDFLATGQAGFYKLFDSSSDNANTWANLVFDDTTGVVSSGLTVSNLASGLSGTLIVGTASNGAGNVGDIYLQVVPEPSAYALLGAGLAFLYFLRRRKA